MHLNKSSNSSREIEEEEVAVSLRFRDEGEFIYHLSCMIIHDRGESNLGLVLLEKAIC